MSATLRARLAGLPPLPEEPRVSVLMAVRNESAHIGEALAAVCGLDWPRERLEIVVADGDSDDDTARIVDAIAARDARVRRLDNPARHVAAGLNLALAAARGEVVVRVDGHCRVPQGYVRAGVAALRTGAAECAGGPVRATGRTPLARAIALAMSSRFGVGGASFRWASDEREVDHVPFGIWRREVFDAIGAFDERLVRNQDDELSDRLRRAGGRIRLLPTQPVTYWSRGSLGGLWRQYFGYGFWKVRVIRRRGGRPSSLRHVVPSVFLLALAGGGALAALTHRWEFALAVPAAYGLLLAAATAAALAARRDAAAWLLPLVIPVLHAAYGAGFLAALPTRERPAAAAERRESRAEAA